MTVSALRPFHSALSGDVAGSTRFGYGWRELLFPVTGLSIHVANDRINNVDNLLATTVAAERDEWSVSGPTKSFLLLPDEFVVHVDAAFVDDDEGLCGLRLRTNLRTSPWFGRRGASLVAFDAPTGLCIKSLHGTVDKNVVAQLGVVYVPLAWDAEMLKDRPEDLQFVEPEETLQRAALEAPTPCESVATTLKAIVIETGAGGSVRSITALSRLQYETLQPMDGLADATSDYEHWFVLADGEVVTAVEVSGVGGDVRGLRFVTSRRKSLWYGSSHAGSWHETMRVPDGASVCGFRYERRREWLVNVCVAFVPAVKSEEPSVADSCCS